MNIKKILIKVFLGFYLACLLPHIFELPLSIISIFILGTGIIFAIIAHQSRYTLLAILFLILHMTLELPHMFEHVHYDSVSIILGHSIHIIFDIILLYTLIKSWKEFLSIILLVLILGFGIAKFIPVLHTTKPFILGGVLGCVVMHLLFQKNKKPTL